MEKKMKSQGKRLQLNKETVRELSDHKLQQVNAGANVKDVREFLWEQTYSDGGGSCTTVWRL